MRSKVTLSLAAALLLSGCSGSTGTGTGTEVRLACDEVNQVLEDGAATQNQILDDTESVNATYASMAEKVEQYGQLFPKLGGALRAMGEHTPSSSEVTEEDSELYKVAIDDLMEAVEELGQVCAPHY